jgi:hypothetical protein
MKLYPHSSQTTPQDRLGANHSKPEATRSKGFSPIGRIGHGGASSVRLRFTARFSGLRCDLIG